MIIDKVSRAGCYPARSVAIDDDRRAVVSYNETDEAFLMTAVNGESETTLCGTPEAAWAMWVALTGALIEWGGEPMEGAWAAAVLMCERTGIPAEYLETPPPP